MNDHSYTHGRLNALRKQLPGRAIVLTDPANVNWLTGLRAQGHRLYGNTPLLAVVGPHGTPRVVVHGCDLAWVARWVDPAAIHSYGSFVYAGDGAPRARDHHSDIESATVGALEAAGAAQQVLIDGSAPLSLACGLRRSIEPRELAAGDVEIAAARRIKDAAALEAMRRANAAAEAGILAAVDRLQAGVTERQLLAAVRKEIVERGAEPLLGAVGVGDRAALVDAEPSDRAVRPGEAVRFDIGCSVDGFHADLSRTAVLGPVDPWISERYAALLAGERAAIAAAKPGVRPSELFEVAIEAVRAGGIADYDRSHCGHGIGATIYEPPLVGSAVDEPRLEEGMTLCIETPWYCTGRAGLQVEDAVLVTATGCERLGSAGQELIVVT